MLTAQEMEENVKKFRTNFKNLQIKNNLEKLENSIGNQMLSGTSPDLKTIENLKKKVYGDKTFEPISAPPYQKIEEKTSFINARNYLKNLFNPSDRHQLNILEANYLCKQIYNKSINHFDHFSFHDFKSINRHFFEKYREGAGEIRDQDLKKNSVSFVSKDLIEDVGDKIFKNLRQEDYLIGLNAGDFSKRAGDYLGQLTKLHAFHNGNGRANRTFISELADLNGFSISWQNMSQKEMKKTSIMACKGDSSGLADLLHSNLLEKDLEKITDLMKGISDEITVKRVNLDKTKEYQGVIIAESDYACLQQQKENHHEIIFHERINFESHPIDIIEGEPIYEDFLEKEWLLDYDCQTMYFEGEREYLTFGHESPEQDNTYDQKKENIKTSKYRDDYEEDYER